MKFISDIIYIGCNQPIRHRHRSGNLVSGWYPKRIEASDVLWRWELPFQGGFHHLIRKWRPSHRTPYAVNFGVSKQRKKGFRRQSSAIFNGRTCSRQKFVAKLRPLYLKESFFMLPERSTKNYLIQYLCQYVAYFCSCQCPWFSCAFGVPCCTKCWHR